LVETCGQEIKVKNRNIGIEEIKGKSRKEITEGNQGRKSRKEIKEGNQRNQLNHDGSEKKEK
jgi:hypothetical protein